MKSIMLEINMDIMSATEMANSILAQLKRDSVTIVETKSHQIFVENEETIYLIGKNNYFSWFLYKEYDAWHLYSIYGKRYKTSPAHKCPV